MRQVRTGAWEVCWTSKKLLPPPSHRATATYDTEERARRTERAVQAELDRGVVRPELLDRRGTGGRSTVGKVTLRALIDAYERDHPRIAPSERPMLRSLDRALGDVPYDIIDIGWVRALLRDYKVRDNLAPGTISKRIACLGRVVQWHLTSTHKSEGAMPANPFHLLHKGYAGYGDGDAADAVKAGGERKENVSRNRRLEPGEEERILAVLRGHKPERWERPAIRTEDRLAFEAMFLLALETAMRMRELCTLTVDQVSFDQSTLFLDPSKNGDDRQVPITTVAEKLLREYLERSGRRGRLPLFPFWDGKRTDKPYLDALSTRLSQRWARVFEHADCPDLHFHDLRHEAVSRIYMRTNLTDLQVSRITGHRSLASLRRYASLRGSELASKLW